MIDSVYWIWFQLLFGIGTRRAELFLNYFGDPKEIYDGIAAKAAVLGMLEQDERDACEPAMQKAAVIKERTLKKGAAIITPDHPDYPPQLAVVYSRPAALYVKGDITCLKDTLNIAMVGTRKYSEYGAKAATMLASRLASAGAVVISGLAKGIDTQCHAAALEAGGKTIGVLGCGLDIDYPKGNAAIKTAMSANGAVITEYPLGTEPRPANFPIRNRIISGLSHGVVVVEADLKSGSIITANHALEQGRDIFAVPGSIFSLREQGTHRLIQDGAKLVGCVEDILEEYEASGFKNLKQPANKPVQTDTMINTVPDADTDDVPVTEPQKEPQRRPVPDGLSEPCEAVYAYLTAQPITIDAITLSTNLELGDVLTALTELEIYGLIRSYPGRRFALNA